MTSNADFKRRVRERMARTGESYATARATCCPGTLHVTNGDRRSPRSPSSGSTRCRGATRCTRARWSPGGRALRAQALGAESPSSSRATATLDSHHGDFVLWFEADLYDQLQLVEILARLRGATVAHHAAPGRRARRHRRTSAASAS